MFKIAIFLLSIALIATSCGRKANLTYEGKINKPDFSNVIEEE